MGKLGAILSLIIGTLGTLSWLVLLLAGMPNSSPAQLRNIKLWMLLAAVGGAACFIVCIWLMFGSRYSAASWVGVLPTIMLVVIVGWLATR